MKLRYFYVDRGEHPVVGRLLLPSSEASGPGEARYQDYLANTMQSIAPSESECVRLIEVIDSIDQGRIADANWEGNEVELSLSPRRVQVDITVNPLWTGQPEGAFTLEELKHAVEGWQQFLSLPKSSNSFVEVDL